MNRIYQGRVSKVEVLNSDGSYATTSIGSPDCCPIWHHHCIFQDAVNYYLTALGSLADAGTDNRVIQDLRVRLGDSWEKFPRGQYGASSLRDSLRRSLPELKEDATLQEAFNLILKGNEAAGNVRTLALALILAKCGGDAAIQQGGRAYLPRLCDAKSNPNWDFSPAALQSGSGAARLASVLHAHSSQEELEAVAGEMNLSWVVKVQPGKSYLGDEAKVRLIEALNHLLKQLKEPSPRLVEALTALPEDPAMVLEECLASVPNLADTLEIPRNRRAAQDLTFAAIAFQLFPGPVTRCFLKLGIKAPKASGTAGERAQGDELFSSLGDDPVKLARGVRGYVFPAFTALPRWAPVSAGEPVWKEFDIAAFKEALKSLNQFNQKTLEREGKLKAARQTLDYMLGKADTLPKSAEGDGEVKTPPRPGKDPRWPLVAELEKELSENLNEGGWQLSRSALRGLNDIVEIWNKHPNAPTEKLQEDVKTYQADEKHKRDIGSVQLFLLLCEERYRSLWQGEASHDDDDGHDDSGPGILKDAVQIHQLEREIERFREPIKLTPAEPAFSRRLFMFSDLTDKLAKVRFGEREGGKPGERVHFVETAIALKEGSVLRETRVRIDFTAPRLNRDELLGGAESRWLQPMTAALGLELPELDGKFDSAVALMPERSDDGSIRHLLNFPVSLDPGWLHVAIGKAGVWKSQFNGIKDKNLHLHWESTAKDATKKNPWWQDKRIIKNGFTVLSNDLGQRSAGAWALLRVTCWKPETNRPVRSIGHDGTREWFAEVLRAGMYRLPGEELKVQNKGTWTGEKSGKTGRIPTPEEYEAAVRLAEKFGCESVAGWFGEFGGKSLPELADQLIKIANRRLTRLGTYHRWSCFAPEKLEDPARREKVIEGQIAELESYQDPNVRIWQGLLEARDVAGFRSRAATAFEGLREDLENLLVNLANFAAPLRQKLWVWRERPGSVYGDLLMEKFADHHPKVRGQRGLSMPRLEQLDGLHRLFLRYNRSLDRTAGTPATFGRADRGRDSGEPCQPLLDKIDRMKEQRVNQTAHLILAQALGVRLRPHQLSDNERGARDIHGEYEKIPDREPVDFIVIEDLSRYLSSQGRAPSENSKLMKWAHRAVRDKLKMLAEEPFGIPVVETVPAYSSRFHAVNGQPGSRLHELPRLDNYRLMSLEKLAAKTDTQERHRAKAAGELLEQFLILAKENAERRSLKKPPLTLYFPQTGGPLFLAAQDGSPVQADTNAAVNLGLRAIASPDCIDIHRRIRATKEKEIYRPKLGNAREKAAFSKNDQIVLAGKLSSKFGKSTSPNFFHEPDGLRQADGEEPLFDRAKVRNHDLVSGVALWSTVNNAIFIRCAELNRQRLKDWKLDDDIP